MVWLCHHSSEPSTISRVDAKESMEYGAGRSAGLLPGPTSMPFSIEPGTEAMQQISTVTTCHNITFAWTWTVLNCLWNACRESAHTGMSKKGECQFYAHCLFLFMTIHCSMCRLYTVFVWTARPLESKVQIWASFAQWNCHFLSLTMRDYGQQPVVGCIGGSGTKITVNCHWTPLPSSIPEESPRTKCGLQLKTHLKSGQAPKLQDKSACLIRDRWHFVDMFKCFWSLHLNVFMQLYVRWKSAYRERGLDSIILYISTSM